jgi:hypothetical protein
MHNAVENFQYFQRIACRKRMEEMAVEGRGMENTCGEPGLPSCIQGV